MGRLYGAAPNPRGFWHRGWEVVGAASRRFQNPQKLIDRSTREVLILPSTFVGLGNNPSVESSDFTRSGENVYLPTAKLLAYTILHVRLRPDTKGSFAGMMDSWASYFFACCNFDRTSLDGKDDDKARNHWLKIADRIGA
ncbi:hypothetical protein BD410DRAFT_372826 [Rickenella mellea]|uniref:Uncharacterized protein n=1 Tax=Rickenella mellea TaxID=50990 RepID=A0A4Y7PYI5_9AGAM|nr:hypothetical protein BD410DRAFT_372826 [Rickenella mellea]